jgi:hypothetical protein
LHNTIDAFMVLLPKTAKASAIKDYHSIALIHTVSKLISKVLANRLAPKLGELVHVSQSAFIKGCFIQDNFKLVQPSNFNARKVVCLLLKVDIARAFDSVSLPFLLQVMQAVDFSRIWRDQVSALLSTASTRVFLNGTPEERVCHACDLRQGDPLSRMMFLLTMEVLSDMVRKADTWSLLQPLGSCPILHRASVYTDDLVLFATLGQQNLQLTREILSIFENASGLGCNMAKCQMAPNYCSQEQVALAATIFPILRVDF